MPRTKKVDFSSLKPGDKFSYQRRLCVVDAKSCGVCLSDGEINYDLDVEQVTPVKVKITRR